MVFATIVRSAVMSVRTTPYVVCSPSCRTFVDRHREAAHPIRGRSDLTRLPMTMTCRPSTPSSPARFVSPSSLQRRWGLSRRSFRPSGPIAEDWGRLSSQCLPKNGRGCRVRQVAIRIRVYLVKTQARRLRPGLRRYPRRWSPIRASLRWRGGRPPSSSPCAQR